MGQPPEAIRETSNDRKVRVGAVVINSVKHDARVMKEAESAAAAGFDVTIVGVKDNENLEEGFFTPGGVPARLVAWRSKAYRTFSRTLLALLPLPVLFYLIVLEGLTRLISPYLILMVLGGAAVGLFWVRLYTKNALYAQRYAVLEYQLEAPLARRRRPGLGSLLAIPMRKLAVLMRKLAAFLRLRRVVHRLIPNQEDRLRIKNRLRSWRRTLTVKGLLQTLQRRGTAAVREQQMVVALEEVRPDIVHCHDVQTLRIGMTYKKRHRVPVVFDSHELFGEISLANRFYLRRMRRVVRKYQKQVNGFITINESIATRIREEFPHLPNPVIVKNATRRTAAPVLYDGRLHGAADLERDVNILLYQGGFSGGRGLDILVEAAKYLPDGWHLVMMGWGAMEARLRAVAQENLVLGTAVSFLPKVPQAELRLWTAGATVGVIPYEPISLNNYFCTPNKLWEYPDAGVPLLVSPFPEMRKVVESYGIGWLLPGEPTPEEIGATIADLTAEEIARAKDACANFIRIDNWDLYEQRLVQLYSELASTIVPGRLGRRRARAHVA